MNILKYLLEKYPNERWDWKRMSRNPNLTMDIIEKYPNKPWNWESISQNPNITIETIEKYPNKPRSWQGVSLNPNITIEFIEKNINNIDFEHLSTNKFTLETKQLKKKESYWLLEEAQVFNKTENLVILSKYM